MTQHKHAARGVSRDLIKRVLRETIVDTRRYRYYLQATVDRIVVLRTRIENIGTTAALDPWEVVADLTEWSEATT